jgi:hypothetical protein
MTQPPDPSQQPSYPPPLEELTPPTQVFTPPPAYPTPQQHLAPAPQPYPGPPAYGAPQYIVVQQPPPPAPPSNPAAVWSMILGIVQLLFGSGFVWFLVGLWTVPVTALTLILGHIGLKVSARVQVGKVISMIGLALGYLGALNLAIFLIFAIVSGIASASS